MGTPHEILYAGLGNTRLGVPIWMRVTNETEYRAWNYDEAGPVSTYGVDAPAGGLVFLEIRLARRVCGACACPRCTVYGPTRRFVWARRGVSRLRGPAGKIGYVKTSEM